jgi:hypothetical protein
MGMSPGTVVIIPTGQCGTLEWSTSTDCLVHLANGDIWQGPVSQIRATTDRAEQDAAPRDIERKVTKPQKARRD